MTDNSQAAKEGRFRIVRISLPWVARLKDGHTFRVVNGLPTDVELVGLGLPPGVPPSAGLVDVMLASMQWPPIAPGGPMPRADDEVVIEDYTPPAAEQRSSRGYEWL